MNTQKNEKPTVNAVADLSKEEALNKRLDKAKTSESAITGGDDEAGFPSVQAKKERQKVAHNIPDFEHDRDGQLGMSPGIVKDSSDKRIEPDDLPADSEASKKRDGI